MAEDQTPDAAPDWSTIAAQFADGLLKDGVPGFLKAWQSLSIETHGAVRALDINFSLDLIAFIANKWRESEEAVAPLVGAFVAPILGGLFGGNAGAADFSRRLAAGGGEAVARSIVEGFMHAVTGGEAGELAPSQEGSTRIATAAVQATIESQINALIPELVSDFLPLDFGKITALTDLPEGVIRALGVERLVRRGLAPLVDATAAGPMKRYVNRAYRPTQLGVGEIAKQLARGRWSDEDARGALAEQGYDDDAIEALINSVAKFHSVSDAYRLVRAGQWSLSDAIAHLTDQGYTDDVATQELTLEKLKAIETFDRAMADAGVAGFVAGNIDEATLAGLCSGTTITDQEKAQYIELAHARRIAGTKPLTAAEAESLALAGILSPIDYREALVRENRAIDAADALELRLRQRMDAQASLDDLRRQQAADKAARQAAAEAAALAKKQAADDAAAVKARGKASDIEQAVIRGIVPIARLEEIYRAQFDDETTGILVALVAQKRQDYVDQQAARTKIVTAATARGVNVAQLEAAVAAGVLTLAQFHDRLVTLTFAPADADLLTATLSAKLDAAAAANTAHAAAVAAAAVKHIDLAKFEQLVRRGHRTLAEYGALLSSLGYDDASRAALVELLQLHIDDAATAAQARAATDAAAADKGLSLEQFRRAVILGASTIDAFQTFLVDQHYTTAAQTVLVAELRQDVTDAEAARQRRSQPTPGVDARRAPLADVARAARLGIVPVDVYTARLVESGYTSDDVALETDLLVQEIADTQAARAKAAAADAAAQSKGLSLADVARAVRAGVQPIASYQAALTAAGIIGDDAATLLALLQSEIDAAAAAKRRRAAIIAQRPDMAPAIPDLEQAVILGQLPVADYAAQLAAAGVEPDDVDLLVGLLHTTLDKSAPKAP